jgi:hypothetical protein
MQKAVELSRLFAIAGIALLLAGRGVWAQSHPPLQNKGGPVLSSFEIHPLYYGEWTDSQIDAQQNYLKGLAKYMSGELPSAPCVQPMLWQYTGSGKVKVADPQRADSHGEPKPKRLTQTDVENIIASAQPKKLPPYDKTRLLIVFAAHGFILEFCGGPGIGCHRSDLPRFFGPN